ncbi:MAG: hypothetical protein ACYTEQ_20760 [Planctomycetota bacterium]|jgi:hypothetical protein
MMAGAIAAVIAELIIVGTKAFEVAKMIQSALDIPEDRVIRELSKRHTVTDKTPEEALAMMKKVLDGNPS